MRWASHVAGREDRRGEHRILVGRRDGKRPLGRPRRWWEDDIEMDLQQVRWGRQKLDFLTPDRETWRAIASAVMNLRVP